MASRVDEGPGEPSRSPLTWIFKGKYTSLEKYFWYHFLVSALLPRSCFFLLGCAFAGPAFPVNSTDCVKSVKNYVR